MAKIKISQERYETLLDIETRVDVLLSKTKADKYMSTSDMYRILGNEFEAQRIEKERDKVKWDED
ncbi:MAG: hypothetical protein ACLR48_10625 [Ruminococcus sp.]